MACRSANRLWEMADIFELIDDTAPVSVKRGPRKIRISN